MHYFTLELIDSTSTSRWILSNLGNSIKHITIISDCEWPSWLHVLDIFLESSETFKTATIIVPSFACLNYFGTSRTSRIKWKRLSFETRLSPLLDSRLNNWLHKSDLVLINSSEAALTNIMSHLNQTTISITPIIATLHGTARLRCLKRHSYFN